MRTHAYKIPAGKDVHTKFHGVEIVTDQPETLEEAVPRFYADVATLVAAANRDRMISQNRIVRKGLAKEDGDVSAVTSAANTLQLKQRVVDPNAPKKAKSSGVIKAKDAQIAKDAAERASRLDGYRKIRAEAPQVWKQMLKVNAVTQSDLDALDATTEAAPTNA